MKTPYVADVRVGAGVVLGGVGALVAARRTPYGHGYYALPTAGAATRAPTPHLRHYLSPREGPRPYAVPNRLTLLFAFLKT